MHQRIEGKWAYPNGCYIAALELMIAVAWALSLAVLLCNDFFTTSFVDEEDEENIGLYYRSKCTTTHKESYPYHVSPPQEKECEAVPWNQDNMDIYWDAEWRAAVAMAFIAVLVGALCLVVALFGCCIRYDLGWLRWLSLTCLLLGVCQLCTLVAIGSDVCHCNPLIISDSDYDACEPDSVCQLSAGATLAIVNGTFVWPIAAICALKASFHNTNEDHKKDNANEDDKPHNKPYQNNPYTHSFAAGQPQHEKHTSVPENHSSNNEWLQEPPTVAEATVVDPGDDVKSVVPTAPLFEDIKL